MRPTTLLMKLFVLQQLLKLGGLVYRMAIDKYLGRGVPGREVLKEIRLTSAQIYRRGREVPGREIPKEIRLTSAQIYRKGREVPGREVLKEFRLASAQA